MDGIRCVIEESKRRRKHITPDQPPTLTPSLPAMNGAQALQNGLVNPTDITNLDHRRWSASSGASNELGDGEFGDVVPMSQAIYQNLDPQYTNNERSGRKVYAPHGYDPDYLLNVVSISGDRTATRIATPPLGPIPLQKHRLPDYFSPLPAKISSEDIDYLFTKGALTLPESPAREALLRAYLEFVHPFMPLIELNEFLRIVQDETGESGKLSLLLFQAVMFAGAAFVDMQYLKFAGYSSRKMARKAFFQKARVLYDFDYETDRVALVQALLLMTYWYETPDDQKDTWHWMGVAISLAHTIGLHRNPDKSSMEPQKKKLWKRIWWSCFMRDRLIALGMRRPTRIKDEDYDVPMLTQDDFEIGAISTDITLISTECTLLRDEEAQVQLAQMCIAKAKLCLCISHVLSAQYSVLVKSQGKEGNTRSSVMLIPKKLDQSSEVKRCDEELKHWIDHLPSCCAYRDKMEAGGAGPTLFVQRALLRMIYFTTLSALHRPQVLPSASSPQPDSRQLQDLSRKKVREASKEITRISQDLHMRGLERYLPTAGVTVLLPAIIIHLLDIKASNDEAREIAVEGFCHCMQVLERLRDSYASADFATQFLEAAIRKAGIDGTIYGRFRERARLEQQQHTSTQQAASTPSSSSPLFTSDTKAREMRERERQQRSRVARHTPPLSHEEAHRRLTNVMHGVDLKDISPLDDHDHDHVLGSSSWTAHTPPDSEAHSFSSLTTSSHMMTHGVFTPPMHNSDDMDFTPDASIHQSGRNSGNLNGGNGGDTLDISDFLNLDSDNTWTFPLEQGAHGESGGFMGDMNWIDSGTTSWSRLNSPLRNLDDSTHSPTLDNEEKRYGRTEEVEEEENGQEHEHEQTPNWMSERGAAMVAASNAAAASGANNEGDDGPMDAQDMFGISLNLDEGRGPVGSKEAA